MSAAAFWLIFAAGVLTGLLIARRDAVAHRLWTWLDDPEPLEPVAAARPTVRVVRDEGRAT